MKKINVRVSVNLDNQLSEQAALFNLSKNELINLILKSYLGDIDSSNILENFNLVYFT